MSDTENIQKEAVTPEIQAQPQVINQTIHKGGFMSGGWFSTLMFLVAFFLVSYSLGVVSERNNKLSSVGTVAGAQNTASAGNFNVAGFKKLAADLKLDTKKFDACLDSGKTALDIKKDMNEGSALGVNGTPSFVINNVAVVGAQPLTVFQQVLSGAQVPITPEATASAGLYDGKRITSGISMENVRVKGDKNAPMTIVEYSDFQCPFCGRFYTESYKQIDNDYIKTGKAKLVFKDFPLSIHPQAPKAAEAARCAQEQGKFWEMHDKLFELQVSST